jgi:hypothetical protein
MQMPNIKEVVVVVVVLSTKSPMVVFVFFVKKKLLYVHSTHSIVFHVFRKM